MKRALVVLPLAAVVALAGCGGSSSKKAKPGQVTMKNIQFHPANITVKVGQTITWTDDETVPHDVKADSGAKFASGIFGKGKSFRYTPTKPGVIKYECTIHPGMVGTVNVTK